MFNSRYLAQISDDVVFLYSQLEAEIKKDIFRRLNKLQKITDATLYQMELLKETSGLKYDIFQYIKKYDKKFKPLLVSLYNDAMKQATETDLKYFKMGLRNLSPSQYQIMSTSIDRLFNADTINKTFAGMSRKLPDIYESFTRMTLTVADATCKNFLKECNSAYMQVSSGAFSWDDAFKKAVINLASDGVKTVLYSGSGHPREYTIEAAAKMNILTGINQTASQQTIENCDDLGVDLVEVSAHIGARPEHERLQGRVYGLNGARDYIDENGETQHAEDFRLCRLGEADGICGINCRHSFYPYVEGTPRLYSQNQLDEMKDERVILDGKKITPYEAEQDLRLCERNIRNYKSIADGLERTGRGDSVECERAKNKIYEWQGRARHITDETGIERKYINEYIGTPDGKQPRGTKPKEK